MVEFGKTLNDVVKSDWKCHAVAYMELKRALSESHHNATATTTTSTTTSTAVSGNNTIACSNKGAVADSNCGVAGVNGCVVDPAPNNNDRQQGGNGNDDDADADADADDDVHSVHTESSYCISDNQKANFFSIYEDSVRRLTDFYDNKVRWAREEQGILEKAVGKRISDRENYGSMGMMQSGAVAGATIIEEENDGDDRQSPSSSSSSSSSASSFLNMRIANFSRDLGLALEFLELNATAFSKIMKKFDKRTGSDLREAKLKELKAVHPYLYDGGELRRCKQLCAEWTKRLQLILQRDSKMVAGRLKGHFDHPSATSASAAAAAAASSSNRAKSKRRGTGGGLRLSLQNSLRAPEGDSMAKLVMTGKDSKDFEESENPQESSEMPKKAQVLRATNEENDVVAKNKPRKEGSVRFDEDSKKQSASRSIYTKSKDFRILQNMIDRVNEELGLQKADSPFFDKAMAQTSPPSFVSSEVELAGELGQGEFCKIYEVTKFNVPESCHICFLHRGYNDPNPSLESPKKVAMKKVPSTLDFSISVDEKDEDEEDGASKPVATATAANNNEQPPSASTCQPVGATYPKSKFSFSYDTNISDYDDLESDHEDDANEYEYSTRGFMKDHCLRDGEARYAIKRIRSSLVGEEEITDAAIDLAREADILAGLKHPNIIRIRGTINVPGHPKYSIILDRLYDTLEVQMTKWKVDRKRYQGKFKGLIGKNKIMLNKMWMDRLVAAYDLSRAVAYMHSHGILHRDIKPANVGFDIRGDIKIFDFGLAKELKPSEREGQDQYQTSGLAGTRRYMAPEVAQVMPYGLSSDVYSFGILMWEMLSLKAAFEGYNREKHYKEVVVEGKRPKVAKSWPFVISNILQRCWHKTPLERPSIQSVCQLIKLSMPEEDNVELSGRSNDLLLRSERSTRGDAPDLRIKAGAPPDSLNQDGNPSDSLSQSIRIKNQRLGQRNTIITAKLEKKERADS